MSLIKLNNKLIKLNNKLVGFVDPYNPPDLPPYTIRLKYKPGTTPTFSVGTGTLVDAGENIWDLTYENSSWTQLLSTHDDLLEVLGANSTGVTNMVGMFYHCEHLTTVSLFDTSSVTSMRSMFNSCYSLTSVPLFDTSKVTDIGYMFIDCTSLTSIPLFDTSSVTDMGLMFYNCTSLTSIPLFDTSKVTDMIYMFIDCTNVESGALSLYQQASTQTNPPTSHTDTFKNCGLNTTTGAAELSLIPTSWGGTMQE